MTYREFCKAHRVFRGSKKISEALNFNGLNDIRSTIVALHIYPDKRWIIEEENGDCWTSINGNCESGSLEQVEIILFRFLNEKAY